ncbi:MAG: hypothetical protein ACREKN_05260 [Longimicrobiaceae bacterium]
MDSYQTVLENLAKQGYIKIRTHAGDEDLKGCLRGVIGGGEREAVYEEEAEGLVRVFFVKEEGIREDDPVAIVYTEKAYEKETAPPPGA